MATQKLSAQGENTGSTPVGVTGKNPGFWPGVFYGIINNMIILGIDPGTAEMGAGVIEANGNAVKRIYHCCIKTKTTFSKPVRLKQIHDQVKELIEKYKVEAIAMESLFFNTNAKSASAVGQAMGAVMVAAGGRDIPVRQYSPLQIKKYLTGYGRAKKRVLQSEVRKRLKVRKLPRPVHAADALAVAICHALIPRK